MNNNIELKQAKTLFKLLIKDDNSIFFTAEKINNSLLRKAKKSVYSKDKVFLRIYNKLDKKMFDEADVIPNYTPFVEKKKKDLSILFSI